MKKALAILTVLAVVAGAAFADTFGNEAAVTVEGNATLTWGIDLDGKQPNGFKNGQEFKVTIPLLTKQTFTHKSEGDSYAEINLKDTEYTIKADNNAFASGDKKVDNVEAKLVFGPVYVVIEDKPGFKPNNADIWAPIKNDGYFDDNKEGKDTFRFEPGFDVIGGTKVGYKAEKFDIAGKIGSKANWETQGKSQYAVGFDLSVTPSDMITASASANYAMWNRTTKAAADDEFATGIMSYGLKVEAKPVTDLTVTLAVDGGNDYVTVNKDLEVVDAMKTEVLFKTAYKFLEAGAYYATAGFTADQLAGIDTTPFWFGIDSDGVATSDLAVYGKVTDGDFVENLDASLTVMAYHLLSDADAMEADMGVTDIGAPLMALGFTASYKIVQNDVNYIKPFVELFAQNNGYGVGYEKGTEYAYKGVIGADYGLFTNTVITAKYWAGETQDNKYEALLTQSAKQTKGIFTLACKVTY